VILDASRYDDWLHCAVEDAPQFLVRYPAERLVARAAPRPTKKPAQEGLPGV